MMAIRLDNFSTEMSIDAPVKFVLEGTYMNDPRRVPINCPEELLKFYGIKREPRKEAQNMRYVPGIKDVIFNGPATIVIWNDLTKTVVKAQGSDIVDEEKGLAMAIAKKALGNKGNYYETIKKWTNTDRYFY